MDAPSQFTNNGNQKPTQEFNYTKEFMSEIYDTKTLPEGIFPVNLKNNLPKSS